jgi:hypothetical protein
LGRLVASCSKQVSPPQLPTTCAFSGYPGNLKAVWPEFFGSVFGRFSAKLGPETPPGRRGSSCSAGCTKNQPGRPILRPFHGANKFRPDCLQVPRKGLLRPRALQPKSPKLAEEPGHLPTAQLGFMRAGASRVTWLWRRHPEAGRCGGSGRRTTFSVPICLIVGTSWH